MRQIIKYFAFDLTAGKTAELVGMTRASVSHIFIKTRVRIAQECERASPFGGTLEVDESYFGARRVRGRRGRGATGKTIVFGIFRRNGSVYTEIVPDVSARTLQAVIRGRIKPDSVIHSDGWRGYNGLVDVGCDKHFRVNHSDNQFADGSNHINGIESFWSFAKRRLHKFNGIPPLNLLFALERVRVSFQQPQAKLVSATFETT